MSRFVIRHKLAEIDSLVKNDFLIKQNTLEREGGVSSKQ